MTTLENRPHTALLVVDVQNGVVGGAHERDAVVANVGSLVEKARREQIAVVWVQHSDGQLAKGSDDWRIVPELTPGDAEPLVEKSYGDAFEDTTLETVLSGLGVGRLVVVGAETDACIRSTLHGAVVRGYDASLVSDAHTTGDKTAWGAPPPDQVIAHTNLYWTYTTAPGRTAGTVETKGVDFASALSGRGNTYVPAAAGDAEGRITANTGTRPLPRKRSPDITAGTQLIRACLMAPGDACRRGSAHLRRDRSGDAERRADPPARTQWLGAGQAAGDDQVAWLEREAAGGELLC
jgi:hypothetical protein